MAYSKEKLYADVAQVQHHSLDLFGSGRLIGRNLVLTARHVVTPEGNEAVLIASGVLLTANTTSTQKLPPSYVDPGKTAPEP